MTARALHADVVIVGAGIAGGAAALCAAKAGLSVIGIDKSDRFGGTVRRGGGGFCVAGSRPQSDRGIDDSPSRALADLYAGQSTEVDRDWARFYFRAAPRAVAENFAALGISVIDVIKFERDSVPRWHFARGGGVAVADAIERALHEYAGSCVWHYNHTLSDLILENDRVVGVDAVGQDGTALSIRAGAVILATGGFSGNPDLVAKFAPDMAGYLAAGGKYAQGDALVALEGTGADFVGLDRLYGYGFTTPDPRDPRRGISVRGIEKGIWLNRDMHRFIDESATSTSQSTANAVLRQPGGFCWAVFDASMREDVAINDHLGLDIEPRSETLKRLEATSPDVVTSSNLAELAETLGSSFIPAVEHWNALVESGIHVDAETGRCLDGAVPLRAAPFTAIRLVPGVRKSLGGVRTDRRARVIGQDRTIPGLYAAGELAGFGGGNLTGTSALEGMMVGGAFFSGQVAGRHAAREIKRSPQNHSIDRTCKN